MIELAKHIEVLLLENDCVIVPGLGGFIAHTRQAEFKESENSFCSPARTIGFNPQLVMNDGLLVQTYMQAYNTDFPDATRKIEKVVSAMKEQLYQTGEVSLPHVGTLYYTMNGTYVFEPSADKFFTPYLYGLSSFQLTPLQICAHQEEEVTIRPFISERKEEGVKQPIVPAHQPNYKRAFQRLGQHAVGIAAAILLFFLLSVPVENTYMDDASYASLSAESMFDAIRNRSAATQLLSSDQTPDKQVQRTKSNVNTLKPVSVKYETVAPAEKPATKAVEKETNAAEVTAKAAAPKATEVSKPAAAPKATKAPVQTPKMETTAMKAPKAEVPATKAAKASAPKATVAAPTSTKGYYIIVASLATSADAQKQLKAFQSKGYDSASVLESSNRHRIALYRYSQSADAYKKLKELRTQEEFKNAWVFTAK